jgi:regulator of sigma E protease
MTFISIICTLGILTFLVIIHELGHFFIAKKYNVHVEEFGIGLPPKMKNLFIYKKTQFSLNLIPLGGFVKLFGEYPDKNTNDSSHAKYAFCNISPWKRLAIVLGGPMINIFFAWILCIFAFSYQITPLTLLPDDTNMQTESLLLPTVSYAESMNMITKSPEYNIIGVKVQIIKKGLAEKYGMIHDDTIIQISENKIYNSNDIILNLQKKNDILIKYERDGNIFDIAIPYKERELYNNNKIGITFTPEIQIQPLKVSFTESIYLASKEMITQIQLIFLLLQDILFNTNPEQEISESIMGPIGIMYSSQYFFMAGWYSTLLFVSIISLSLGVMNLLPIPVLDGGRACFIILEILRKKTLPYYYEYYANAISYIALMGLLIYITFYDIQKIF